MNRIRTELYMRYFVSGPGSFSASWHMFCKRHETKSQKSLSHARYHLCMWTYASEMTIILGFGLFALIVRQVVVVSCPCSPHIVNIIEYDKAPYFNILIVFCLLIGEREKTWHLVPFVMDIDERDWYMYDLNGNNEHLSRFQDLLWRVLSIDPAFTP